MRSERKIKLFNDLLELADDINLDPGDTFTIIGPEVAGLKVKVEITIHIVDSEDKERFFERDLKWKYRLM